MEITTCIECGKENCDSQTETYKGRNKGKGRKSLAKEEQLQQMGS